MPPPRLLVSSLCPLVLHGTDGTSVVRLTSCGLPSDTWQAEKEHQIVGAEVHRVNTDDTGLYFDVSDLVT